MRRTSPQLAGLVALGLAGCSTPVPSVDFGSSYAPLSEMTELDFPGLVGVPNLDDDNENGEVDWDDFGIPEENDLAWFTIPEDVLSKIKGNRSLLLSLSSGDDRVRVWTEAGALVLGENGGGAALTALEVDPSVGVFGVEFRRPLDRGTLALRFEKAGKTEGPEVTFDVMAAPLVMNHHLQPAEQVMAVSVSYGGSDNNNAMIADYQDALGDDFLTVNGPDFGRDPWLQDEIEFATYASADSRIDLVIDSIRDRGLDDVAEELFEAPEFLVETWGSGIPTSQDSFGNLEATPPVTVDGVPYPFGRVYYGDAQPFGEVTEDLREMFDEMKVQAPFQLDTSWLCVGHVDEFMSWVPDPSAPKGWRLVYTDIPGAWEVMEGMDPSTPLPRYASGHGIDTVGEMVEDAGLRTLNQELWDDYLEPNLEILREKVGVTDEDIVWMPGLFEVTPGCGGTHAALIPGMANLIVSNFPGETVKLFMADPFTRADLGDQSSDPMIAEVRARFPNDEVHFLDDWSVYHLGLGEVHCGSNVIRTPVDAWWRTINAALEN